MDEQKPYDEAEEIRKTQKFVFETSKDFEQEKRIHWLILHSQLERILNIKLSTHENVGVQNLLREIEIHCSNETDINKIVDFTDNIIGTIISFNTNQHCSYIDRHLKDHYEKITNFLEDKKRNINAKIDAVIEKTPITKFIEEAKKHNTASNFWIITSFILVLTLFYGLKYLYDVQKPISPDNKDIALYLFMADMSKKIIFSAIMLFFFGICIKQFKINRHLYTLNKAKEHAYLTYINMIGTAKHDEDIKNLKQEISKCIFTIPPSGYLGGDDGDMKALEILKYINLKQKE